MKRLLPFAAGVIGGAVAYRWLQQPEQKEPIQRFRHSVARRMVKGMETVMDELPEDSPPKLVVSTLPRLQEQQEEMLTLLREQNELLRQPEFERHAAPLG